MAAALFEKQLQAKREAVSKAKLEEEAARNDADAAAPHASFDQYAHTGPAAGPGQPVGQAPALPHGWGAAWDAAANAYYYYNSTGQTQWDPPVAQGGGAGGHHGSSSTVTAADDDSSLPPELRRELKKQAQRGGGSLQSFTSTAPVVTQEDFWNGEKHKEYTSMSAAYHVPMNVLAPPSTLRITPLCPPACTAHSFTCLSSSPHELLPSFLPLPSPAHALSQAPEQLKPGQLAKRKHQITDVLHMVISFYLNPEP